MLFQNHLNWLSKACAIVALCFSPIVLSAQIVIYSEDFESETPVNAEDLCDPVYTPLDASWALGPACSVPTNGIPKLVDVAGDAFLEFNQRYPSGSEVWNSADIDVSAVSSTIVSFDARSVGGHENAGTFQDEFALYVVRGGVQDASPIVSFAGHVDGSGDGSTQTEEESFSSVVDVAGDSQIALRIVVGISGSDGSESYQLNNFSVCDDANGDGECTACDEPIALLDANTGLSYDLTNQQVQCQSDLPTNCDPDAEANRGDLSCFEVVGSGDLRNSVLPTMATSAEAQIGTTAAIKLFGIGTDPTDDRNLVPSGDGLFYYQSEETFWVYGHVEDVDDPSLVYQVSYKYAEGVSGSEWRALQGANGANAFKHDQTCIVTPEEEDGWNIYLMDTATTSFIVGNGTYLTLGHAPANNPSTGLPLWGFQVGPKANNTNCSEIGASAWFNYTGTLDGSAITGGFGDLLLDLEPPSRGLTCPDVNCDGELTDSELLDAKQSVFIYTVVDDECGDISEFSQIVFAWDTIAPELSEMPADVTVTCYDEIPALPVITAEDNCLGTLPVIYSSLVYDSTGAGCYSIDRTWLAQDSCCPALLFVSHTQTITVLDSIKPDVTLSCPTNTTVYVDADCAADLSTSNTGDITVSYDDNCVLVTSGTTYADAVTDSTSTGCYTVERTWTATATDDCGNDSTTTCTQTIMVMDNMKPDVTLSCPTNTTVYVDADCAADLSTSNTGDITVSYDDNCVLATSGATYADAVTDSTSTGCYTIERTWTASATDACGNDSTTTCMQTIMVMDNMKPDVTLSCPTNTTVYVDADCAADLSTSNTGDITVSYDDNCVLATSGATYADAVTDSTSTGCYTIERTWTASATDACGNDSTTTCMQTIMVMDNIKPSIDLDCPENTTVYVDANCAADLSLENTGDITVSYDDNCLFTSSDSYNDVVTDSTSTGCYTIERTWTASATDACGNDSTTTCTQTIMVMDNIKPDVTLSCPNDTMVVVDGSCYVDLDPANTGDIIVSYDDNCLYTSSDSYNDVVTDSTGTGCYTIQRTWTASATDACGNDSTATCMQTIIISDTEAPTWDAYDIYMFVSCDEVLDPTDPTLVPISATDNCSGVRYEIEAHQLSGGCPGTWMRLWTAIDSCGNRSVEAQQYLQQWDSLAPVLTLDCPADISLEVDASCESGSDTTVTGSPEFTVIDNCDADPDFELTFSDDDTTSLCGNTYQFVRTWQLVAEDVCENKDTLTCEQTITLVDSIAPIVIAALDTTVECDGMGNADAIQSWLDNNGGATASDNCSEVSWSNNYNACDDGAGSFKTYRQGSWGNANNHPAAALLDADFDAVFPEGLTAGCDGGFKLDFTTADAIDTYLPCTGGAQDLVLTHGGTNPTEEAIDPTCWDNALVSHIITAKLNVEFDAADADFSASDVALGDLIVLSGPFMGMRMQEVIEIADGVLGGCRTDYTPQQSRVALRAFNKNYDSPTTDRGFVHTAGCLSDGCGETGTAIVTFTATDSCGNAASTTATFTIEDTMAPVITGQLLDTLSCEQWVCDADALIALGIVAVSDECGGATLTASCAPGSGGCGNYSAWQVTYTATDDCGLTSTFDQIVILEDLVPPTVTIDCPDSATVYVDAACNAAIDTASTGAATYTADDNCWLKSEALSYADAVTDSTSTGCYTIERTWTAMATDSCGNENSATCSQTIMVMDNIAPTIALACPGDYDVFVDEDCAADLDPASYAGPAFEGSDNCVLDSLSLSYADVVTDSTSTGCYTIVRTWTGYAADACGNDHTESCSQTISVKDNIKPDVTLSCPTNTTVYVDADCAADLSTSNTGDITVSYDDNCVLATSGATYADAVTDSTSTGCYTIERTWTASATDACGNDSTTTCMQTIMVMDNMKPDVTLSCPTNTTVYVDADCAADLSTSNTGDITVSYDDNCVLATSGATYADAVTDSTSTGCYTIERTWTASATDACGNDSTTTCMQTIMVMDNMKPSIDLSCPTNTTVYVDADCAADLSTSNTGDITVSYDDNCVLATSGATYADAVTDSTSTGCYTIERTWTASATDACGNDSTTTCMQTIMVMDNIKPDVTLSCPTNTTVYVDADCAADLSTSNTGDITVSYDDNCVLATSGATYADAVTDSTSTGCYTIERTWTASATDACGNDSTTTCMQTIMVMDNIKPDVTLSCPTNTTVYVDADCAADLSTSNTGDITVSYDDNCVLATSGATYADAVTDSTSTGCYTIERTWTASATDACGNDSTTTCMQTIMVMDNIKPSIDLTCPSTATVYVDADCAADLSTSNTGAAQALFADNCVLASSDLDYADAVTDSTSTGCYTIERTWTANATDACGNDSTATCMQTIMVMDNIKPDVTLSCPTNTTVYVDADCAADLSTSNTGNITVSYDDNCVLATSGATYADAVTDSTSTGCYTIERTWTASATDACGNDSTTTCMQTIMVMDNIKPDVTLSCPTNTTVYVDADCAADLSTSNTGDITVSYDDNCVLATSGATYADAVTDSTSTGCYTIERTWTASATDACGNDSTTTCMQTIMVMDNIKPSIDLTCPTNTTVYVDADCAADLSTSNTGDITVSYDDNCVLATSGATYADAVTDSTSTGCYTIERTWTASATDACGNDSTTTCMQTIMVMDNMKPDVTLSCPTNTTVYVDADCAADLSTSNTGNITVSYDDNCVLATSGATYADAVTDSTSTGCYTIERTWTASATDACGNDSTTTCTQTIMVMDNTKPELEVTGTDSIIVYLDEMCMADTSYATIGGLTWIDSDNCTMDTVLVEYVDSPAIPVCTCDTTILECPEPNFRTQTMGGWGTNCNGNNPGCYRDANFDDAFPSGIQVGCAGGNTLTLTTSNAVANFLPCGGSPGALTSSGVDGTCTGNVLAGQTFAAKLSLGFDANDPDFSVSTAGIDELYRTSGAYAGWTIGEILDRADSVLGGCLIASASGLNEVLTNFNETYVSGAISEEDWSISGCEEGYYIVTDCDSEAQGSYSFTRDFTVTAKDECGNDSTVTYTQTVEVLDMIAPQITAACGFTNGGSGAACCTSLNGEVDWSGSLECSVSATDNCDTEVSISIEDDFDGSFAPNEFVSSYCHSYEPEAFEGGETCTGHDPHNLRLFSLPGVGTENFTNNGYPGVVENNTDGTWSLTQEVISIDGSGGGWIMQVTYSAAMDWDEWTSQAGAHTFKLDCGDLEDLHEEWEYRVLESGQLIGTGTYYGDTLNVFHAPGNELFGFQIGLGASGQNSNYGYGAWLYYSGQFQGQGINGTGDIFGDLDCCLPWSVTRTWTAEDDCQNESTFSYTLNVNDEDACEELDDDALLGGSSTGDHTPVVLGGSGDLTTGKTPIRVTNLQPNPTNDWSLLGFTVTENMRLRVDMVAMDGTLIAELYDGIASPNVNHTLDIEANDLDAGMYQIRLSSAQYLVVKKLLVSQ